MNIIELILDENDDMNGIEAISVVENPAIEEDFVALKSDEIKLAEVDKEKRILMGAALIPNKPIYRRNGKDEFYIFFSKETVLKASQLYLKKGRQGEATLEHQEKITGLTVVESWLVEDEVHDKSRKYGLNMPLGTWMVSMKVDNDEIWNDYVKTGKVKGFSIEGYFADKLEMPQDKGIKDYLSAEEQEAEDLLNKIVEVLQEKQELESYTDYPSGARSNAKRALEWAEKNGWGDCGTGVGKARANQLAKGEPISRDTIARMASFKRHEQNKDTPYSEGCGGLMWDAWGGSAGVNWAISKLDEIDQKLAKSPCWDGYEQKGYKMKNGKKVPNCVKK
jgi:hypothetical protein